MLTQNSGSFRDPSGRVYETNSRDGFDSKRSVLRGLNDAALKTFRNLNVTTFFRKFAEDELIVSTKEIHEGSAYQFVLDHGWSGVIEHDLIPFISYPYEWTFSMLKDAALLHLQLLERALLEGWSLKDGTPYNIQFKNARPIFIDIPSFEPRAAKEPWLAYRQFCMMFLTPLLLRSHLGINHATILRSNLEGLTPTEAVKYFHGTQKLKKGVLSHIVFPSKVENRINLVERNAVVPKKRTQIRHSDAMVIGLVQSMQRLVTKLTTSNIKSDWSDYDHSHTYADTELAQKLNFVDKHASAMQLRQVWDLGCNSGLFSDVCAKHADMVLSIDNDHETVEKLYFRERAKQHSNILPLVMDLANISPNQGWAGQERKALGERGKPDLILSLALIHHLRISSNIPTVMVLKWLRDFGAAVIIEFVDRSDAMVMKLLANKSECYADYNREQFSEDCRNFFDIQDSLDLKNGRRTLFYMTPKNRD